MCHIFTTCFVKLMELKQKKYTQLLKSSISVLFDIAASFTDSGDSELDLKMLNEMLIDSITNSEEQIQNIYKIIKKSNSQDWINHRKGR